MLLTSEKSWDVGDHVGTYRPQFKFPVHQGILDYNGTKSVSSL
jgi:hypothetical protein